MQNVWKGLIIGGLTGVVAGAALDTRDSVAKRQGRRAQAQERRPEMLHHAVDRATHLGAAGEDREPRGDRAKHAADRTKDAAVDHGRDAAEAARRLA